MGSPHEQAGIHLFVTAVGEVRPRWADAFPGAVATRPADAVKMVAGGHIRALWLCLQGDPFEAAKVLAADLPVPVIVLSERPEDEEALETFSGGARGYCNMHALPAMLQRVWAVVESGALWVGEPLMMRLARSTAQPVAVVRWPQDLEPLSRGEQSVLEALVRGNACREVAAAARLTEKTVRMRLRSILAKAGVEDRYGLARRVAMAGGMGPKGTSGAPEEPGGLHR